MATHSKSEAAYRRQLARQRQDYVGGAVGADRRVRLRWYAKEHGVTVTEALKTAIDMLLDYEEDGEL